ncbi:unknown [Bacteroides sp. CAG:1060]|nr:unknown [Bacteroides sp. CAG:1060]
MNLLPLPGNHLIYHKILAMERFDGNHLIHTVSVKIHKSEFADLMIKDTMQVPLSALSHFNRENSFRAGYHNHIFSVFLDLEHAVVTEDGIVHKSCFARLTGIRVKLANIYFAGIGPVRRFTFELADRNRKEIILSSYSNHITPVGERQMHAPLRFPSGSSPAMLEHSGLFSHKS